MGASFTVQLDVTGHRVKDVSMTWGLAQASEIRCHAPSYGTEIEVPAVIELLDLVVAGDISAEDARACLNRIAVSINEQMHHEYSRRLSFDENVPAPAKLPAAPEAPVLDSRWVYAVSSESDPKAIKIGVAGDIPKRLRSLQIGSASPIALRWSTRGGYPLERHLHETFDKRRISGEWFDFRRVADPVKKIDEAAKVFLKQFDTDQSEAA